MWTHYIRKSFLKALAKATLAVFSLTGIIGITGEIFNFVDIKDNIDIITTAWVSSFLGIMVPASKKLLIDLSDDGMINNEYGDNDIYDLDDEDRFELEASEDDEEEEYEDDDEDPLEIESPIPISVPTPVEIPPIDTVLDPEVVNLIRAIVESEVRRISN